MLSIQPRLNPDLQDLLQQHDLLFRLKFLDRGPLHILFPAAMEISAQNLRGEFSEANIENRILFAHKPTKSKAFLAQALKLKLDVDVASYEELCNALSVGFKGEQIECTGIKDTKFLQLALFQRCLIVADSV